MMRTASIRRYTRLQSRFLRSCKTRLKPRVPLMLLAGILLLGFQSASAAVKLRPQKMADGFDAASAGLVAADIDGDGNRKSSPGPPMV
jgi:hypothetical protein